MQIPNTVNRRFTQNMAYVVRRHDGTCTWQHPDVADSETFTQDVKGMTRVSHMRALTLAHTHTDPDTHTHTLTQCNLNTLVAGKQEIRIQRVTCCFLKRASQTPTTLHVLLFKVSLSLSFFPNSNNTARSPFQGLSLSISLFLFSSLSPRPSPCLSQSVVIKKMHL